MKNVFLVSLLVWVSACGFPDGMDSWDDMVSDGLDGTWSLRAHGDLEECSEYPELNGPIVIRVDDLEVIQSSTGKLTLAAGAPEGFILKNGLYDYPSFRFDTEEETPLGTVKLFFEGSDDFGSFYGNFTGEGPGTCRIKNGTFDLMVERSSTASPAEEGGEAGDEEGDEAGDEAGDEEGDEGSEG